VRPDAIVVPLGSGGTAAGLLLGLWLAEWNTDVCAVRVTDPWWTNHPRVMRLVHRTAAVLRRHGRRVRPGQARLRVVKDQLGPGYGHLTEAGRAAAEMARGVGIKLDGTYSAKAWAALQALAPSFPRLCFWHTFDARLVSGPPLEHALLRQARAYSESLWPHPTSI
jgi:D-cysteine desulfhydrase